MNLTTVLFDLDGTLLPMDNDEYTKGYFKLLGAKLLPLGYETQSLVEAVWKGTYAMIENDGSRTNETAFWDTFCGILGEQARNDMPVFTEFYEKEFQQSKALCGFNPMAAQAVHRLKEAGYRVALATNPIFPSIATESRIRWAGLEPEEFELFTTYENTSYCKPNPDYYKDVCERLKVLPEECIMVGNDVTDDGSAKVLGMQVFLETDWLINRKNEDISVYPNGTFEDLLVYLDV